MKVEVRFKSKIVLEDNFERSMTVRELQEIIQDHLNSSFLQMYTKIHSTEVLMAESWELAFFQSSDPSILKIELKQACKPQSILEEAVSCCTQQDDMGLLFLFTDRSEEEREFLLNTEIESGWTLLHFGCKYNMEEFIILNHEYFRDFNQETFDDWTPLLLATANACENIVNFLLEMPSVLVNKSTNTKTTALHIACSLNSHKMVEILTNNFADPSLEDLYGKTPLEYVTDSHLYRSLVGYVRKFSLQGPMSNVVYEGFLSISSMFKRSQSAYLKINLSKDALEMYKTRNSQIEDKLPILRVGLRNIEMVRSACCFDLFNKYYYFKIKFFNKEIVFNHISKSYRDDWVNSLTNSVEESQNCPAFEEIANPSWSIAPDIEPDANEDSFEFLKLLGKGTYASVYKARSVETGTIYAIKRILKKNIKLSQTESNVTRECKILEKIRHPFVVSVRHIFENTKSLNIVLDYCPLGDLDDAIRPEGIDEKVVRFYMAECLLALEYLQSMNIMHRDLKPANILIDESGHIKLTDFGLSKEVISLRDQNATFLGTPLYVPPENIQGKTLTHTYDLYSLGVIMFELITGQAPYYHSDHHKLFRMKTSGKLNIPSHVSVEATSLLKILLNRNPERRPYIAQVKEHPFFKGVDWEKLLKKEYKPPLKYFVKGK